MDKKKNQVLSNFILKSFGQFLNYDIKILINYMGEGHSKWGKWARSEFLFVIL